MVDKSQEEADRALALLLAAQDYGDELDGYYGYNDDDDASHSHKKKVKKRKKEDDEYNPTGKKSSGRKPRKSRDSKPKDIAPVPSPPQIKEDQENRPPIVAAEATDQMKLDGPELDEKSPLLPDTKQGVADSVQTGKEPEIVPDVVSKEVVSNQSSPERVETNAPSPASHSSHPSTPVPAPKKLKTVSEGMNTGKFTDEEVKKFKEGLELYGREWAKLAKHVATRDSMAIRSHAQKYFIKLFRDGTPLPDKVKESGEGYTLSGKELDPDSAAARPYFRLKSSIESSNGALPSQGIEAPPSPSTTPRAFAKRLKLPKPPKEPKRKVSRKPRASMDNNATNTASIQEESYQYSSDESYDSDVLREDMAYHERTEYAKRRPTRAAAHSKSSAFDAIEILSNTENAHVMIPCERYLGKPASGIVGCQPFKIQMHRRVLAMMDLHAHLMVTEVIGFLAGTWDPQAKTLEITAAIPCRSVEPDEHAEDTRFDDRHFNVELDPQSELETRELLERLDLRVVGWYHSHPTFAPNPSLIDLVNQRSYQQLFKQDTMEDSNMNTETAQAHISMDDIPEELRDEATSQLASSGPTQAQVPVAEPFVGAIVGPYDLKLPKPVSAINWFHVGNREEEKNRPKRLVYEFTQTKEEVSVVNQNDIDLFVKLIRECGNRKDRVEIQRRWRPDADQTMLEKLRASLFYQLTGIDMEEKDAITKDTLIKANDTAPMDISTGLDQGIQTYTVRQTLDLISKELSVWQTFSPRSMEAIMS